MRFVKVKRAALVALEALPDAEAATAAAGKLSLAEIEVRLLSPACGTMEQLQATVSYLTAQVKETVGKEKPLAGTKRRRQRHTSEGDEEDELSLQERRKAAAAMRAERYLKRDAGEAAAGRISDESSSEGDGSGSGSEESEDAC